MKKSEVFQKKTSKGFENASAHRNPYKTLQRLRQTSASCEDLQVLAPRNVRRRENLRLSVRIQDVLGPCASKTPKDNARGRASSGAHAGLRAGSRGGVRWHRRCLWHWPAVDRFLRLARSACVVFCGRCVLPLMLRRLVCRLLS